MLTKNQKVEIVNKFGKNNADTGSTEVQVALLSKRINSLTDHLRCQPKDFSSRRGLLKLVGQRRNFMNYLKNRNSESYSAITKQLEIRVKWVIQNFTEDLSTGAGLLHGIYRQMPFCTISFPPYPVTWSLPPLFLLSILVWWEWISWNDPNAIYRVRD